jgi:hypothetical protein
MSKATTGAEKSASFLTTNAAHPTLGGLLKRLARPSSRFLRGVAAVASTPVGKTSF